MMNCSVHQQREASGSCVYCGKFFCNDCLIEIDNKFYCKEHVKLLIQPSNKVNQSQFSGPQAFEHRDSWQSSDTSYRSSGDHWSPNPPPYQPNVYINNNNMNQHYDPNCYYHHKSRMIAILLCFFFGFGGFHRFYVGKVGTGLIWMFSFGFFGIGWLIDMILLVIGGFRDVNGQFLD